MSDYVSFLSENCCQCYGRTAYFHVHVLVVSVRFGNEINCLAKMYVGNACVCF